MREAAGLAIFGAMPIARKARVFWPVLLLWVLADCTTKDLAETHLVLHVPREIVGETVRFTLAYNPGAAMSIPLGLGDHSRFLLAAVAVVIVGVLARMYRRTEPNAALAGLGFALVIGGALGNLFDRVRSVRGVVDFIDVGVAGWRFWTFNVADIGVTVGAVLLAWQLSRLEGKTTPAPLEEQPS